MPRMRGKIHGPYLAAIGRAATKLEQLDVQIRDLKDKKRKLKKERRLVKTELNDARNALNKRLINDNQKPAL
jgi:hypothetical protein